MSTQRKRQVYRYTIPVDDKPHTFPLTHDPLHVANGAALDEVDFWAEHDSGSDERAATFQVFATGQALPDGALHVGSCRRGLEGLVRHLYRLTR